MNTIDDFRIRSHELLVELDAATCRMMMLVSAHKITGPEWLEAVNQQHVCFERWIAFVNEVDAKGPTKDH
nr:hypothetical protein [Pseudomonas fluorescens]